MCRAILIVSAAWLTISAAQANDKYAPLPQQLRHCTPHTLQSKDIIIDVSGHERGKSAIMPNTVSRAIDTATNWVTRPNRYISGNNDASDVISETTKLHCKDIYPLAHAIALPNGLTLYAVHASSFASSWLLLVAYDPASGKASAKPAYTNTKWMSKDDLLLLPPYISTADLRSDGHQQIVVEERGHNGTMYNAAVYRYFDIAPDLTLTNVMALEARTYTINPDDKAMIVRTLTPINATHVRIDQAYVSGTKRISGGYAILESPGPGKPYYVSERHAVDSLASPHFRLCNESLVTMSETDDDLFLKEGHGLYY